MRLGWLVPPGPLYADLVAARHAIDLGGPALVLGYAAHPPDRLYDAVQRLAAALPN